MMAEYLSPGTRELYRYFGLEVPPEFKVLRIDLKDVDLTELESTNFIILGELPERLIYLFHEDKQPAKDDN